MVAPSVTPASVSCSFSGLTLARRAGANRSAIVARAADLEFESSPAAEEPSVAPQEESLPPPPPSPEEGTKLYVGNIPWSYDSKQLAEVFQDVGDVELVEVPVIFLHANWLTLTSYPLEAFVKSSDRMLCSMATLSNGIWGSQWRRGDFDVGNGVNYGVASSASWSKSDCNPETSISTITRLET